MVAPIAAGVAFASGTVLYAAYRKGKSKGIEKGKEEKEQELNHEVKGEIKDKLREEAKEEFDKETSLEAHQEAIRRSPPVDIGDQVTLGVKEIKKHHSGKNTAVCKKEGFIIFVEGIPQSVDEGDVITAEITSFGRNKTSAEATYQEMN